MFFFTLQSSALTFYSSRLTLLDLAVIAVHSDNFYVRPGNSSAPYTAFLRIINALLKLLNTQAKRCHYIYHLQISSHAFLWPCFSKIYKIFSQFLCFSNGVGHLPPSVRSCKVDSEIYMVSVFGAANGIVICHTISTRCLIHLKIQIKNNGGNNFRYHFPGPKSKNFSFKLCASSFSAKIFKFLTAEIFQVENV